MGATSQHMQTLVVTSLGQHHRQLVTQSNHTHAATHATHSHTCLPVRRFWPPRRRNVCHAVLFLFIPRTPPPHIHTSERDKRNVRHAQVVLPARPTNLHAPAKHHVWQPSGPVL